MIPISEDLIGRRVRFTVTCRYGRHTNQIRKVKEVFPDAGRVAVRFAGYPEFYLRQDEIAEVLD
jgi:hypothetical protein